MGLFSALDIGKSALAAQAAALQVAGNNVANAATPGYSRQRVNFEPLDSARHGQAFTGLGVGMRGVRRIVDLAVEQRLAEATSRLGALNASQRVLQRVEASFNALSDQALSRQLSAFFSAAQELSRAPGDVAARRVFLERAQGAAQGFNQIAQGLASSRRLAGDELRASAADASRLLSEVASLNEGITRLEIGGTAAGQANDLRDKRGQKLQELAQLLDFRAVEQRNGSMDITSGGQMLVRGATAFGLSVEDGPEGSLRLTLAEGGQTLAPAGGSLGTLLQAHGQTLPRFARELDRLAQGFIQAVNAAHAQGAAAGGFSMAQSRPFAAAHALSDIPLAVSGQAQQTSSLGGYIVDPALKGYPASVGGSPTAFVGARVLMTSGARAGEFAMIREYDPALGRIGFEPPMSGIATGDSFQITSLDSPLKHGSLDLVVANRAAGSEERFVISLDLDQRPTPPATNDTTLAQLVDDINGQLRARFGTGASLGARVTPDMRLEIASTSPDVSFRFENDSSGFVAASGLNTLFSGHNASNIALEDRLQADPLRLSAGLQPGDNSAALQMAAVQQWQFQPGVTLEQYFEGMAAALGVQGAEARELAENQDVLVQAAKAERETISGVNIDEEAVSMMTHQRAFQAAARFVSIVDQLMATLMQSI